MPAGYCTEKLFVPKLNTFGRVGLNGSVIHFETGGTPAIAIPCGAPENQPHSAGSDLLEYAVMAKNLPDNWGFRRH